MEIKVPLATTLDQLISCVISKSPQVMLSKDPSIDSRVRPRKKRTLYNVKLKAKVVKEVNNRTKLCCICSAHQDTQQIPKEQRQEMVNFLKTRIFTSRWKFVCGKCLNVLKLILGYTKEVETLQEKIEDLVQCLRVCLKAAKIPKIDRIDTFVLDNSDNVTERPLDNAIVDDEESIEIKDEAIVCNDELDEPFIIEDEDHLDLEEQSEKADPNYEPSKCGSEISDWPKVPKPGEKSDATKNNVDEQTNKGPLKKEKAACHLCQSVILLANMTRHIRQVHEKVKNFNCEKCGYGCFDVFRFNIHLKHCNNPKRPWRFGPNSRKPRSNQPVVCEFCQKTFPSEKNLRCHIDGVHHKSANFQCDQCPFRASYIGNLRMHFLRKHETEHVCNVCKQQFPSFQERVEHFQRVHSKKGILKCDKCSKTFTAKYLLKNHIEGHLGIKKFQCQYCGKQIASKVKRDYHEAAVCGNDMEKKQRLAEYNKKIRDKMKFKCTSCGCQFVKEEGLKMHHAKKGEHGPRQKSGKKSANNFQTPQNKNNEEHEEESKSSNEEEQNQGQSFGQTQPVIFSFPLSSSSTNETQIGAQYL